MAPAVKRGTLNMYDTSASRFSAAPSGPFEAEDVRDGQTAQQHFDATREIKLKEHLGSALPVTSYRCVAGAAGVEGVVQ